MGPCPLYVHAYNTKSPLHSSIYGGMRSNSLLEFELARTAFTPLDISPEAKYCLYAHVTITSGKSSAWSIRNSRHRTRMVDNRRPRPRSGWSKKGMFGYVQLIVVARQLQITSSVARGANVRECRIDDLRSSVCTPISSCQSVGDIEMCQGGWISKIAVDEQEYGDEDGNALEHCNPRICLGLSVQSRMLLIRR